MDWMSQIVEEKIREAIERGELDNLQGAGKPLKLEDDSMIPAELRASYRLMKNAGVVPEELQLHKDMLTLQDLINCCRDDREREKLHADLSVKKLRYQTLMSQRGWHGSDVFREYERQITDRLHGE